VDALRGEGDWGEARALLRLDALPGVGPATVRRLVEVFGSAEAALEAPGDRFAALAGRRAGEARARAAHSGRVEAGLDEARRRGMTVLTWSDPRYPDRLHRLADPPPVLFLHGTPGLVDRVGVAVVGARRATLRGRDVARLLGQALGAAGVPVVSGLALGVDGAAHTGALEAGGLTLAVLGSGPDRAYPRSHAALFRRVLTRGLVVSEFLPGTPAHPYNFPRRNRILAALAHTLVVVEAGVRSGALITVDHALDLGLDVWAVPGPIDSPTCVGSNALLQDGARPLVSVEAFVAELRPEAGSQDGEEEPVAPPVSSHVEAPEPRGEVAAVLTCLAAGEVAVDDVARATGLSPARALALLTRLELDGRARRLPGPRFRRAG